MPPHSYLDGPKPGVNIVMGQVPHDDQVSIIVVHRDRPEYLNVCLQSIAINSSNNHYEIIVVDNNSTKQTAVNYLQDLQDNGECKVIRNKENYYFPKAANMGAKAASKNSRYLIFMHDDVVILNPAWIDLMINLSDGEKSGHVGISMYSYEVDRTKYDFIEEWCMLVTRECWEDCGPLEEDLPILGAPFLFTLTTQYSNHRPQIMKLSIAHHYANFSLEVNEYEKGTYDAIERLPHHMRKLQQKIGQR